MTLLRDIFYLFLHSPWYWWGAPAFFLLGFWYAYLAWHCSKKRLSLLKTERSRLQHINEQLEYEIAAQKSQHATPPPEESLVVSRRPYELDPVPDEPPTDPMVASLTTPEPEDSDTIVDEITEDVSTEPLDLTPEKTESPPPPAADLKQHRTFGLIAKFRSRRRSRGALLH